jgi:peptidoglycan/LPS O-acetylase OafA/YrhL
VTCEVSPATAPATVEQAGSAVTTAVTGRYLPALDGLRALAVGGVVAYHLGFGWAAGGYLGVDLFFVLSGFLITTLLLEEWLGSGGIRLGAFWVRRAKRLLPALVVVLVAIGLFIVLDGRFGGPGATAGIDLGQLRGDALAALFYVANWHFIFSHQSYFAQFSVPSPLEHTWSLGIEEQFYLVWPPLLVLLLPVIRRHWRGTLGVLTVVGAAVSVVAMALIYHPGGDPSTVYFGTGTRIFDMLAGATVAVVAAGRRQPGPTVRRLLHVGGVVAALGLAVFWSRAGGPGGLPPGWMFRGGFALCAALGAVLIADVRQFQSGPLGRALRLRPLRWIGMISYGIYLWHWPVIVYLDQARTGLSGWELDTVRVAVIVVAAAASFYLVERPIRRMRFTGVARRALVPGAVAVAAAVAVVTTIPALSLPPAATAAVRTSSVREPTHPRHGDGSGGFSTEVPIRLPAGRVVSPADPLRVLILGDSVMMTAEPAITAALQATGEVQVDDHAFPGWGLTTDKSWAQEFPPLLASDRPDLVIAMWSWDDDLAQADPPAYSALLQRAVATLTAAGDGAAGVILLQYPPMGGGFGTDPATVQAQRASGVAAWTRIASSLPTIDPGRVLYLPIASAVAPSGQFTAWLPPASDPGAPQDQWVRVRMIDTVHFCPAGAARYAAALLTDLTELYHLAPAASGWSTGAWTANPDYSSESGACPDDHPPG